MNYKTVVNGGYSHVFTQTTHNAPLEIATISLVSIPNRIDLGEWDALPELGLLLLNDYWNSDRGSHTPADLIKTFRWTVATVFVVYCTRKNGNAIYAYQGRELPLLFERVRRVLKTCVDKPLHQQYKQAVADDLIIGTYRNMLDDSRILSLSTDGHEIMNRLYSQIVSQAGSKKSTSAYWC
ncbi:TPA: hypothetical protein SMR96_001301 [Proteus mirabilis]|uniref:hypothetical protein n=1 Tax=Proteus mirabilis TaxID=584 RepID=UPI0013D568DE|nr:hypothetical protein [Proteus mirabilis]ELA7948807.1 hypothetical protein [Proteus mirabilis]MBG3047920.1 hypothetical protein [Proteus mirabilis]MBG6021305.1 hypothetical protein [Proteus mirabilis]MBI6269321.1 hypothetical protein [Proteus mirabilis]MBI6302609.1 hypothetical protein [Proteus mirabilis]